MNSTIHVILTEVAHTGMQKDVTELEGSVLGLIWETGPCTTYAIRKVFQKSPNPYWSGSAGAIYPLVRRLEGRGLVRAQHGATGRRKRVLYRLTESGFGALRTWLGPEIPAWSVTIPVDPLRTRVRFLGALEPADRVAFLHTADRALAVQIENAEREARGFDSSQNPYAYLVPRGVASVARARQEWIREAADLLKSALM